MMTSSVTDRQELSAAKVDRVVASCPIAGRDRFETSAKGRDRRSFMRRFWTVLAALATLSLTNCGYNAIQTNDEQVKANWSEVVNQYQRRADLVPNLVNSV